MTMRVVAIALVLLGLAPREARADAKAAAKQRIEAASAHHAAGRFTEALHELTAAYSLHPRSDLLYAIAQVHVKLGDCTQAITFYERFLSTRPSADAADAAHEAIEACKTQPPPAPVTAEPAPLPPPQPVPVIAPTTSSEPRRWYKDPLAGGLVAGGIACGVISLISYRSATGDLDAADAAPTYPEHADLVDSARGKRTLATVFAVGGVALVGVGTVRYVMVRKRERRALAIAPTRHGGLVSWSGTW